VSLAFLRAYSSDSPGVGEPSSFDERDLRRANRGGARISAVEIAAILQRQYDIERALRQIQPDTSLTAATRSIPWARLRELFDAFANIRGVGFSKATKALHPKRPALIPMLDSVVQAYLTGDEPALSGTFGERATELVRRYKQDLDRNRVALRKLQRELAGYGFQVSEVRILDLLLWSASSL
jgi:Family of unknown function (DUF6308)